MPFLTLNNYTIPIADGSSRVETEIIGNDERAFSGQLLSDIRSTVRGWRLRTRPMLESEAAALRYLLLGNGHAWDFEDAGASNAWKYSSKGLTATTITNATRSTSTPKYGVAKLQLGATTGLVTWAAGLTGPWTAMVWRHNGSWGHYIETSSGQYYLDGVASSQQGWFAVNGAGDFTLRNTTGSAVNFDDLVIFPFVITASMAAAFGTGTRAFTPIPVLEASGDMVGSAFVRVVGRDIKAQITQQQNSGAWRSNMHSLDFALLEEAPETISAFVNGFSLLFDGSNEYVNAGDFADFDGVASGSWSCWFNADAAATGTAHGLFEKTGATVEQWAVRYNGSTDNINVIIRNTGAGSNYTRNTNGNNFGTGTWYHVVVTWSAANGINIYRNGALASMAAASGTNPATLGSGGTSASCIGASNTTPSNPYPGYIDEVACWAGLELNSTQVTELYNNGKPGDLLDLTFASPHHWWRCGDGDTFPTIADHGIGTASNGTMTNQESGDITNSVP